MPALIRALVTSRTRRRLAATARRTGRTEDEILDEALDCQLDLDEGGVSPWWPFDAKLELTPAGRAKLEALLANPPRPTPTLRRILTGRRPAGKPDRS